MANGSYIHALAQPIQKYIRRNYSLIQCERRIEDACVLCIIMTKLELRCVNYAVKIWGGVGGGDSGGERSQQSNILLMTFILIIIVFRIQHKINRKKWLPFLFFRIFTSKKFCFTVFSTQPKVYTKGDDIFVKTS